MLDDFFNYYYLLYYSVINKDLNVYRIGSNSKTLVLHAIGVIQLLQYTDV